MTGRAFRCQFAVTLAVSFLWIFLGYSKLWPSFAVGAAMATVQVIAMIWSWERVLAKKSIALAGTVIVIKYAVLGILTYRLLVDHLVDPLCFLIGFATVVPTIMLCGYSEFKPQTSIQVEVSR